MKIAERYRAKSKSINLARVSPIPKRSDPNRKQAEAITAENIVRIQELQYKLYAESKQALLVVLQGMDTAGKDGAIRKVLGRINPQGCEVTSFKVPSKEELAHDYLWRIHKATPPRGMIGVFNRSHYEDVLVVRVHNLVPERVWSKRYTQINNFEKILTEAGTRVVKIYLHIDKDEQKERLQDRLDIPEKNWKFNAGDLAERKMWPKYQKAYEVVLEKCSPASAPWYIVPANKKWFRNYVLSSILVETLEKMDPKLPPPEEGLSDIVID